jgi:prepilin-type N-terminal cleavage/methylation domain-containing protein
MKSWIQKEFTLIELLVVVAIIGILASMLLPSLAKARESAKQAVCVSNLKQINLAMTLYTTDNNDRLPSGNGKDRDTWPSYLDPLIGGGEFIGPTDKTRPNQSDIWNKCPNSKNNARNWFRDGDYAGIFDASYNWPDSLLGVDDPSNSAFFTEGNHEVASSNLGNSWLRVGSSSLENEYNNVTGISWGRVRHMFQQNFVISNVDGSTRPIKWKDITSFTNDHGQWLVP